MLQYIALVQDSPFFFTKMPSKSIFRQIDSLISSLFRQIDKEDVKIIAKLPAPFFFFAKCLIRHIASYDIRQIEGIP